MAPEGLPMALFAILLWAILFFAARPAFAGVLVQQVEV
jgi:hypothetical protein